MPEGTIDISEILKVGISHNVSDIIITAAAPPAFRVNGELIAAKFRALTAEETKKLAYGIINDPQIAAFERDKELDFSFTYKDNHRFRGNLFFQRGKIGVALRLIPSSIPTLNELNLPPIIEELAMSAQGFVLFTGPTGHGKSTTQACMLDLINQKRKAHIITIEDPIEYLHSNKNSVIEQREVLEDTHSFANALKRVLRQNPDVVLVGEMRDMESMQAALTAAETGHLVISTLHTNDAVQAVDRIIDLFPPYQQGQVRSQLALSLLAVISQRLLPRADKKGRIPAIEILRGNSAVANLIREEKTYQLYSIMETYAKDGMKTMDSALKELYLKGLITFEEARTRMRNPIVLNQ